MNVGKARAALLAPTLALILAGTAGCASGSPAPTSSAPPAATASADEGAFDVDVKSSGGTGTFTAPTRPGVYAYHCAFHPAMHGALTVQ
jgi:plastocyanin